jgi:hypothetical protein
MYRHAGFTSSINAETFGLFNTATIFFPDSFPVGSTTINDASGSLVNAPIGSTLLMLSAGTGFSDLWTTISSYTPTTPAATITNIALSVNVLTVQAVNTFVVGQNISVSGVGTFTFLNGKSLFVASRTGSQFTAILLQASGQITSTQVAANVLTVTCSNSFLPGQVVELNNLQVSTFLDGQSVTISTASGTQFTAPFTHANYGPTAETQGGVATNVTYGPTADTGTVTGVAYATVANAATSDIFDNTFGQGEGFYGPNATPGPNPSFVDMAPMIHAATVAASAAGTSVFIPSGTYAYNSILDFNAVDPTFSLTGFHGEGPFSTVFIANNPAVATPMGFCTQAFGQNNFSFTDIGVYGNALPINTQPSTGGSNPFAEVSLWFEDGYADGVFIGGTPFLYGIHARVTQGVINDIFDENISYYELDGTTATNLTSAAYNFSPDAPGTFNLGGEGGLVIQAANANFTTHNLGLFYGVQSNGFNTQPITFENCTLGSCPLGVRISNSKITSTVCEETNTVAYVLNNTTITDSIGGSEFPNPLATVVASEGQLPWSNGIRYMGYVATVTSVQVTQRVDPRGIEGFSVTQIDILATNNFVPGNFVVLNVGTATFLNGVTFQIVTSSTTGFTAYVSTATFDHTNYGPTADTGTAVCGMYIVDPAGHKQMATTIGYSGTTQPSWNDAGGTTIDNQFPAWTATTLYTQGQRVWDGTNVQQIAGGFVPGTSGVGVSGGSTPTWNATVGGLTQDGSATWTNIGHLTWQDLGTFTDPLASFVTVERLGANTGSSTHYQVWNAAKNTQFNISGVSAQVATAYSAASPIRLTGLTSTQTGTVVYYAATVTNLNVSYYLSTTTAGTGGTVSLTFHWMDDGGHAQTFTTGSSLSLTTTTGYLSGDLPVITSSNLTVDINVSGATGSPIFSAYIGAAQE